MTAELANRPMQPSAGKSADPGQRQVLLVEDDETLRENYTALLKHYRLAVTSCCTKAEALAAFEAGQFDVVLLDVTLGDAFEAGFELCQHIRALDRVVPIIFLTERDEDADRISGLRLGADDYLSKTISATYLAARITALMRRVEVLTGEYQPPSSPHNQAAPAAKTIVQGSLRIDDRTSQAYWDDQPLGLSLTQFWILRDLASNPGEIRSVDDLMKAAKITVQPNTIVVHIKSIRDTIQRLNPDFSAIRSERARGYRRIED